MTERPETQLSFFTFTIVCDDTTNPKHSHMRDTMSVELRAERSRNIYCIS